MCAYMCVLEETSGLTSSVDTGSFCIQITEDPQTHTYTNPAMSVEYCLKLSIYLNMQGREFLLTHCWTKQSSWIQSKPHFNAVV